ncbi:MAG: lipoate--protein ligase [Flavobacteriales bacterium]|nr:lipoate--protein ligase [Flavobacteriales bacterium]MEB2343055.1 lipoate--protein ligase [Flavobacteriia bacterium]
MAMVLIEDPRRTDTAFNLALEEHCLMNLPIGEDYLLLYVNGPSIVIGKHQNAVEEINTDFVERHGIPVIRRQSGGGTVYHDPGNLNFSFIRRYEPRYFNNYDHFTGRVAEALRHMRVPATLNGRGDILVEGRKVSGNAQAVRRDRMLSHGTLLFRSNLQDVSQALHRKPGKFVSKGRPSVRSQVVNVGNYLPSGTDMEAFRAALLGHLLPLADKQPHVPSRADLEAAEALAREKYRSWDWNYGRSPDFELTRSGVVQGQLLEVRVQVSKGIIEQFGVAGNTSGDVPVEMPAHGLTGLRYHPEDLRDRLLHLGGAVAAQADEWVKLIY